MAEMMDCNALFGLAAQAVRGQPRDVDEGLIAFASYCCQERSDRDGHVKIDDALEGLDALIDRANDLRRRLVEQQDRHGGNNVNS